MISTRPEETQASACDTRGISRKINSEKNYFNHFPRSIFSVKALTDKLDKWQRVEYVEKSLISSMQKLQSADKSRSENQVKREKLGVKSFNCHFELLSHHHRHVQHGAAAPHTLKTLENAKWKNVQMKSKQIRFSQRIQRWVSFSLWRLSLCRRRCFFGALYQT